MAILKCKMCGGDIQATDSSYGICDSCGSVMTLPKASDDQKINLFNRANNLRRQNEFDKAVTAYENILNLDTSSAEAHWGLVLSKFGIEYIEDPATGQHVPTCHRVQMELILTDADYLSALENAEDEYTRSLYEEEARKISEIQKNILAISAKEEPYDVFICYKESTDAGSRTKDSALAQDIYYNLEKEGFKVFFSRISLESKLGQQYEPYIFNALISSKVMLAVGTKPEYFNAVWVKNEWSRFLTLMKKDHSRLLIPCYRDMDAYDLPEEMAMLQSQDMGKIGFIQDITRGIKKILESTSVKVTAETVTEIAATTSIERLIQNGNTYLKLSNYSAAREAFIRVTKEYPEDYRGWWGLIVCKTKGLSILSNDLSSLDTWFKYVKQLSTAENFAHLEAEYAEYYKIVADADAVNEIPKINKTINNLNTDIQKLIVRRKNMEQCKNKCASVFHNQTSKDDGRISEAQRKIDANSIEKVMSQRTATIASIFIVVGILMFFIGLITPGWITLLGIVSGIIAVFIWLSHGKNNDDINLRISEAQSQLRMAEETKVEHKNQYDREIHDFDLQIADINAEIEQTEIRILYCQKYLAIGKTKISEMFYAKRCESIGVNKQFDAITEQLRAMALGQKTSEYTDVASSSL